MLYTPAKEQLADGAGVLLRYGFHDLMVHAKAMDKRTVGLDENAILVTEIHNLCSSIEWMDFNLIYGRLDADFRIK